MLAPLPPHIQHPGVRVVTLTGQAGESKNVEVVTAATDDRDNDERLHGHNRPDRIDIKPAPDHVPSRSVSQIDPRVVTGRRNVSIINRPPLSRQ